MGGSLLSLGELSPSDVEAWRDLAEAAVEPNPFFHPDFVATMAHGLGADVGVIAVREGRDWVACLPVERRRGWRRVPARGLVAWRHLYCFLGTPLIREGTLDPAARDLLAEGRRRSDGFLGLDLLMTDGPVDGALERAIAELDLRAVELDRFERAALVRRPDSSYLALSPKHRRNFERLRRRLEEEQGDELVLRDRTGDASAREEFLRVEASGWKGEAGTGTAFLPMGHDELFLELCERMAQRGMLELVSAEVGGRVAAMLCNLVSGDTAFTFKIGAQHELADYSPGVQLLILYLDHFHGRSELRLADSCAEPGNAMINRLWPDRRHLCIRAIPGSAIKGALARPALGGIKWLRQRRR
jgi:CelD/BcsL family acetyltransferase involved in cellulose biosynthesis